MAFEELDTSRDLAIGMIGILIALSALFLPFLLAMRQKSEDSMCLRNGVGTSFKTQEAQLT
jgi:ribosomal protein S12 methylthiotransferase accessory factor YcaO